MENYTCSECKHFRAGAPGHEAIGYCYNLYTEVWCGTSACRELDLKPLFKQTITIK